MIKAIEGDVLVFGSPLLLERCVSADYDEVKSTPVALVYLDTKSPHFHSPPTAHSWYIKEVGSATILFLAMSDVLSPHSVIKSIYAFVDNQLQEIQSIHHPTITVFMYLSADRTSKPVRIDSPLVDVFITRSAQANATERHACEYTANVAVPSGNRMLNVFDLELATNTIISCRSIDHMRSDDLVPWQPPPSLLSSIAEDNAKASMAENIPIVTFPYRPTRTTTAQLFAEALRQHSAPQADFALLFMEHIQAKLPQNTTVSAIWESYDGPHALCLIEAYGADIWAFLAKQLAQQPFRASGLKIWRTTRGQIVNITVCRDAGEWKQLARSDRLHFVMPSPDCEGLVRGDHTTSHTFSFSPAAALYTWIARAASPTAPLEDCMRTVPNGEPFCLPPISSANCTINTRWVDSRQECVPCPQGFHQPLPGMEHCVRMRFPFLDSPTFMRIAAHALVLFALAMCISAIAFYQCRLSARIEATKTSHRALEVALEKIASLHTIHSPEAFYADMPEVDGLRALAEQFTRAFKSLPHGAQRAALRAYSSPATITEMAVTLPPVAKEQCLVNIAFFSEDDVRCPLTDFDEIRKAIEEELVHIAEAHNGVVFCQSATTVSVAIDEGDRRYGLADTARLCAFAVLQMLRAHATMLNNKKVLWLIVVDKGEAAAGIAEGGGRKLFAVVGPLIDRAKSLRGLCLHHAGKVLWTAALRCEVTGLAFARKVMRAALRDGETVDIYEMLEHLDFMPLDDFDEGVERLLDEDFAGAERALERYISGNRIAPQDRLCLDLLQMSRDKMPMVVDLPQTEFKVSLSEGAKDIDVDTGVVKFSCTVQIL